jgi:hypothetical protein
VADCVARQLLFVEGSSIARYQSSGGTVDFGSGTGAAGSWGIISVNHQNGSAPILAVNGTASGSPGSITNGASTANGVTLVIGNRVAGDRGLNGQIAAFIGFPSAISNALAKRMTHSLATSFKIAAS